MHSRAAAPKEVEQMLINFLGPITTKLDSLASEVSDPQLGAVYEMVEQMQKEMKKDAKAVGVSQEKLMEIMEGTRGTIKVLAGTLDEIKADIANLSSRFELRLNDLSSEVPLNTLKRLPLSISRCLASQSLLSDRGG